MSTQPQLTAAHHIALLLLSSAAEGSREHAEIVMANDAGIWLSLSDLKLVDRQDEHALWSLTERGHVLVEHVLELPLPEPVRAWRMPGAPSPSAPAVSPRVDVDWDAARDALRSDRTNLQPPSADSSTDDEDGIPRPPLPKPIPGIVLAEDPQARRNQARQLLDRGFGVNEIAETLELPAVEVEQMFLAG